LSTGRGRAGSRTGAETLRRHERKIVELPVLVSEAESRVEGGIRFDTRDMSVGGAFLRSNLLFEVGEEVLVAFQTPSGHEVRARARVVRVIREQSGGPPGMGIEFVDLLEADRKAVRGFLARRG
jgi:c-di-GMP-binding flagellar brake protein YcgR